MFSRSVYDILNHEALRQALNASQEMDESRDGYTWLEPGELESRGRRVLGQVRIAGERLTLNADRRAFWSAAKKCCNSWRGRLYGTKATNSPA